MMIEQTVEIPASHRLTIDVPREIPAGPAILAFRTAAVQMAVEAKQKNDQATPRADRLLGIAAHLGGITLEEIRAERLAKYLK